MDSQVVWGVLGVVASILLGTVSNWIYDLLVDRNVFPRKVSLKAIVIVAIVASPFVCLVVWAQISSPDWMVLRKLAWTSVPLWLVVVVVVLVFLLSNWLGRRRVGDLSKSPYVPPHVCPDASTVEPFPEPGENLFIAAKKALESRAYAPHSAQVHVRIYAPVGLWYKDEEKGTWLKTVGELADKGKVCLRAVFTLPAVALGKEDVERAFERLDFLNKRSALVHYFPPPPTEPEGQTDVPMSLTTAPGLGMIIFDEDTALLCFAREFFEGTVSQSLRVRGSEVVNVLVRWFDDQALHSAISKTLINNSDREIWQFRYEARVKALRERYYPELVTSQKIGVSSEDS